MMVDEGIDSKLPQNSLTVNGHLPGLRMDPGKTYETFEVWLHPLRLTTPNVNVELHKAREV